MDPNAPPPYPQGKQTYPGYSPQSQGNYPTQNQPGYPPQSQPEYPPHNPYGPPSNSYGASSDAYGAASNAYGSASDAYTGKNKRLIERSLTRTYFVTFKWEYTHSIMRSVAELGQKHW